MNKVSTIFNYLTNDFEKLWNLIAEQPEKDFPRGNYIFALKSMIFLEIISRICTKTDKILELSSHLDSLYFKELPSCLKLNEDFDLPYRDKDKRHQYLIYWLYKTIRHGTAHYYDQIILAGDDFYLDIAIFGPGYSFSLEYLTDYRDESKHLHFEKVKDENELKNLGLIEGKNLIRLFFNPGLFYIDLKEAVQKIKLIERYGTNPFDNFISPKYEKHMQIKCKLETLQRYITFE